MREHPWQRAASFAARAHEHQVRKDGRTPYFAHTARVALIVSHVFGCTDEAALAAAYLHDVIEDTPADYDEIKSGFGKSVADCVAALTKNMIMEERARERDYEARLRAADWRARLIKLADQYDNYSDAISLGTRSVAKTAKKCRKAMAIAKPDAASRPETRRALQELSALLRRK
jgi:guanosine-3',5'-bis(diphosphate) 3'-pyrophosphohydrolase